MEVAPAGRHAGQGQGRGGRGLRGARPESEPRERDRRARLALALVALVRVRVRDEPLGAPPARLAARGATAQRAAPPRPRRAARPAAPSPAPGSLQSDDFIVAFARPATRAATLAERYLGDADKAWMIEDYTGTPRSRRARRS